MIPISEKEELAIDKGILVKDLGDNFIKVIEKSNIICYGGINFKSGSDDYNVLQNMNWLDDLGVQGLTVPSDYNYEEHCCYPPENRVRYYETFNPAVICQYKHAMLGKPERCCIFKLRTRC